MDNSTTNSTSKLSKCEKALFFFVFPVLYLMVFFTIVVTVIGLNRDLTGFLGFIGSTLGMVLFAIIPCLIATMLIFYLILKERRNQSTETQTVYVPVEGETTTVTEYVKEYIYVNSKGEESTERPEDIQEDRTEVVHSVENEDGNEPVDEVAPVVIKRAPPPPRPKLELEDYLQKVEELKEDPKVTPSKIMAPAVKLEKFKNKREYRNDPEIQARIIEALNWCYDTLGSIEYELSEQ